MGIVFLSVVIIAASISHALAQTDTTSERVGIDFSQDNGFARILLTFPSRPSIKTKLNGGVLAIDFENSYSVNFESILSAEQSYIIGARANPDGKGLRLALSDEFKVNVLPAAEKVFIDLLPRNWRGPPPGLPLEVLTELEERAIEAELKARALSRQQNGGDMDNVIEVRAGEYPTFTRLQFYSSYPAKAVLSRSGDIVEVTFNLNAKVDISKIRRHLPKFVRGIEAESYDSETTVRMSVLPEDDIVGFYEGEFYHVDITSNLNSARDPIFEKIMPSDESRPGEEASGVTKFQGNRSADYPPGNAEADNDELNVSQRAIEPDSGSQAPTLEVLARPSVDYNMNLGNQIVNDVLRDTDIALAGNQQTQDDKEPAIENGSYSNEAILVDDQTQLGFDEPSVDLANSPTSSPKLPSPEQARDANVSLNNAPTGQGFQVEKQNSNAASAPEFVVADSENGDVKNLAEQLIKTHFADDVATLDFDFADETPAAVFYRGKALFIVFETGEDIDKSALDALTPGVFDRVLLSRTNDVQILKLYLKPGILVWAAQRGANWHFMFGNQATVSEMVFVDSWPSSPRGSIVEIKYGEIKQIHQIEDPEVGDRLMVLPSIGPLRGVTTEKEFVEFSLLRSLHGLAIRPMVDNLVVQLLPSTVEISLISGLHLSRQVQATEELRLAGELVSDDLRINFDRWKGGKNAYAMERDIRLEALRQSGRKLTLIRLKLAKLFLGHELANEAFGVISLIERDDPEFSRDPDHLIVKGVSLVLMGRYKEAQAVLTNTASIRNIKEIEPWLAYIYSRTQKEELAIEFFANSDGYMKTYPVQLEEYLRLEALKASLKGKNIDEAEKHLGRLKILDLSSNGGDRLLLLEAQLEALKGNKDVALVALNRAVKTGFPPVEAEAILASAEVLLEKSNTDYERGIKDLENLTVFWRNDETENRAMEILSRLYVKAGRYRDAFNIMKVATRHYPVSPYTRLIQDNMRDIFVNLYLGNGAADLPSIEALALFYDFSELTPVGRQGDEIIRRLVERLISVDLLDQASKLLTYQVDERLEGAARSAVAAQVAYINLMNKQPREAIRVLRDTYQSSLPNQLEHERSILEARALLDLNRPEAAIEMTYGLEGRDVMALRVDALWTAKKWQEAGEAIELMLNDVWQKDKPLTEEDRFQILRAGVAFTLADDAIGIARFREKFQDAMLKSPDANTFRVIADVRNPESADFLQLVDTVAAVDTMNKFLEEYGRMKKVTMPEEGQTADPANDNQALPVEQSNVAEPADNGAAG